MPAIRDLLAAALVLSACSPDVSAAWRSTAAASGPARKAVTFPDAAPVAACPGTRPGRAVGRLQNHEIDEASGLVVSRLDPDLFWVHNDSGDGPRLFAIDGSGEQLAELSMAGAYANDWEDIATGPVLEGGASSLFIGDIGDNFALRSSVQVYVLPEPQVDRMVAPLPLRASAHRLDVSYPDGPRDAETLLVDPLTGDLYIVEKADYETPSARVGVYRIPALEVLSQHVVAQRVAEVPLGPVTAGNVLANGRGVALRNYDTARFFERDPALPLFHAFARAGCELPLADLAQQGEALGFARDGKSYFTVAEGEARQIYRYTFEPPAHTIRLVDACSACARGACRPECERAPARGSTL
jgi:hypothetical protein